MMAGVASAVSGSMVIILHLSIPKGCNYNDPRSDLQFMAENSLRERPLFKIFDDLFLDIHRADRHANQLAQAEFILCRIVHTFGFKRYFMSRFV
jgi:hypothetical protein